MTIDKNQLFDLVNALTVDGELGHEDILYVRNWLTSNGDIQGSPRDMMQVRRGNKQDMPVLAQGELAITLDTEELYVGGLNGNIKVSKKDSFDVKDYGATGVDGNDDTAAIQNAINDASLFGGTVVFSSGTFCAWKIELKSNVNIELRYGATLRRIPNASQQHFIVGDSISNFTIAGGGLIDGNKAGSKPYLYCDSFHLKNCSGFNIMINIVNSVNRGIYIEKNTDQNQETYSTISGCTIDASANNNIWLSDCANIRVSKNITKNAAASGIIVQYTANKYSTGNHIAIEDNEIFNNVSQGIWAYQDDTTSANRQKPVGLLEINRNKVYNNAGLGIITQINRTRLNGNEVVNNAGGAGITVNTSNVAIESGSVVWCGAGIDLGDANNVIVRGVFISSNEIQGIEVNGSREIIIDNCILSDNNTTNKAVPFGADNGISMYHGQDGQGNVFPFAPTNVRISNTVVRGGTYQRCGIRAFDNVGRVTLSNNSLKGSGNMYDLQMQVSTYTENNNVTSKFDMNSKNVLTPISGSQTLNIPPNGDMFFIANNVAVTIVNVNTEDNSTPVGRKVTFIIDDTNVTISNGGNILTTPVTGLNSSLTLVFDGVRWVKIS